MVRKGLLEEGLTTTDRYVKTLRELTDVIQGVHHENLMGDRDLRKVSGTALRSNIAETKESEERLAKMKVELRRVDLLLKDEHERELREGQ